MPIYDYECKDCHSLTEAIHKSSEEVVVECDKCGSENTHRILSPCGWELKGDGWYSPHQPMKRARGGARKPTKPN